MRYLGKSLRPHNPINIYSLIFSNSQGARIARYISESSKYPKCPSCNTTLINDFCNNKYAVCTGSICEENKSSPGNYICKCRVVKGCNTPLTQGNCSTIQPYGNTIFSSYSPYLIIKNNLKSVLVSGGGFNIAGCLGAKCINNGDGTASCYCAGRQPSPEDNVLLWLSGGQEQLNKILSGNLVISAAGGGFNYYAQSTINCFNNNRFIYS